MQHTFAQGAQSGDIWYFYYSQQIPWKDALSLTLSHKITDIVEKDVLEIFMW